MWMIVSERGSAEFLRLTELKIFTTALTTILAFYSKTSCQLYTVYASLILTHPEIPFLFYTLLTCPTT